VWALGSVAQSLVTSGYEVAEPGFSFVKFSSVSCLSSCLCCYIALLAVSIAWLAGRWYQNVTAIITNSQDLHQLLMHHSTSARAVMIMTLVMMMTVMIDIIVIINS